MEAKTMTLVERLRGHVDSRGGLGKDDDGEPILPNGAWAMMLEAASLLEAAERALEPFAQLGKRIEDAEELGLTAHGHNPTQDDLRLARSVYQKIKGEG